MPIPVKDLFSYNALSEKQKFRFFFPKSFNVFCKVYFMIALFIHKCKTISFYKANLFCVIFTLFN
jgi:hypothetical protein